jgi:biopolymer transport protein ExbB/TolQ
LNKVIETIFAPLKETMHVITSGLLIPTIIVLLLLLVLTLVELGGLVTETLIERRRKKVNVPELVDVFQGRNNGEIKKKVEESQLFRRQKAALYELIRHESLPSASLQALARRLLISEELYYARITGRTDLIARLGPMFGLMGTLIPLGPGLMALSQGDIGTLAESLMIAFDTTVIGLASAGIAYFISRLRKRWYEDYLSSLEALMDSLLEVFARGRETEKQKAEAI